MQKKIKFILRRKSRLRMINYKTTFVMILLTSQTLQMSTNLQKFYFVFSPTIQLSRNSIVPFNHANKRTSFPANTPHPA